MNKFVSYLNSLHSDTAFSLNALAENQLQNEFYQRIRVKRPLAEEITAIATKSSRCIILTGHAGDGKTSLLADILEAIGNRPSPLPDVGRFSSTQGHSVYFVKDMSELVTDERIAQLQEAAANAKAGGISVVVSNTGPLLNTFADWADDVSEKDRIVNEVLGWLMKPVSDAKFHSYSFLTINLALLDSLDVVSQLLSNVIASELWSDCRGCPALASCPVQNNAQLVRDRYDAVSDFLVAAYALLQETGHRLTLRQISAHLGWGLTGGLTCQEIIGNDIGHNILLTQWGFHNNLFNYQGIKPRDSQIQAAVTFYETKWDRISNHDYMLFIDEQGDVSREAKAILNGQLDSEDQEKRAESRRTHITYQLGDGLAEFLGLPEFWAYRAFRKSGTLSKQTRKNWQRLSYNALFYLLMGERARNDGQKILVTASGRRHNSSLAELVIGDIDEDEIRIEPTPSSASIRTGHLYGVTLLVNDQSIGLTWPLLEYFTYLAEGGLEQPSNPLLSRGVEALLAQVTSDIIRSKQKRHRLEERIQVLWRTSEGSYVATMELPDSTDIDSPLEVEHIHRV